MQGHVVNVVGNRDRNGFGVADEHFIVVEGNFQLHVGAVFGFVIRAHVDAVDVVRIIEKAEADFAFISELHAEIVENEVSFEFRFRPFAETENEFSVFKFRRGIGRAVRTGHGKVIGGGVRRFGIVRKRRKRERPERQRDDQSENAGKYLFMQADSHVNASSCLYTIKAYSLIYFNIKTSVCQTTFAYFSIFLENEGKSRAPFFPATA